MCVRSGQILREESESAETNSHSRKASSATMGSSLGRSYGMEVNGRYPAVEQEVLLADSARQKSRYKHVSSTRILKLSPR